MPERTPIPAAEPARTFPPHLRQWVDFCCDHSGYGCGHHIDGHGTGGGSCHVRGCRCTVWRDHVGCDHRARDAAERDAHAAGLAAGRTAAAEPLAEIVECADKHSKLIDAFSLRAALRDVARMAERGAARVAENGADR